MDTIKIIKGVFNNEDIIKDNNAIAASFSDGTAIGIDTKNDDKFQKDFLSGSGNSAEKEIYISTIDMLTPEAEVRANTVGGKQLRVTGVRCKDVSHSDSNRQIPDEAVDTLSKVGSYSELALQMPDSASWNFDNNGTSKTPVAFSAIGKSGSVKSTTIQGKFVVTQPIKIQHYNAAGEPLEKGSIVYRKGISSFEAVQLQANSNFKSGKQIVPCKEVTKATKKSVTVSDGSLSQTILSTDKWLKISCVNSCLVVKYDNSNFSYTVSNTDGAVQTSYETTESEIKSGKQVKIGIYKRDITTETHEISDFNAQSDAVPEYSEWNYSYTHNGTLYSGKLNKSGKVIDGGNYRVTLTVSKSSYSNTYTKVNEYSYTPDSSLFYTGIYCDSSWYDDEGYIATVSTQSKIYIDPPDAGDGFKYNGSDIYFIEGQIIDVNADSALCDVDNTGNVTLKEDVDIDNNKKYSIGGNPSFSVSFD